MGTRGERICGVLLSVRGLGLCVPTVPCSNNSFFYPFRTHSDPFCEIFWYNELLGKTTVKDGTLSPDWNEQFKLPYQVCVFCCEVGWWVLCILLSVFALLTPPFPFLPLTANQELKANPPNRSLRYELYGKGAFSRPS